MNQQSEMLQHDAQLILSLFGNAKAQKQRLMNIEQQLKSEGVDIQQLHRTIADLNQVQDPEQYRCRYQPC
ncbi:MAG: hypothetical protein ACJAWL_002452 [Motiliproteus sp.]|jgi:hypothetical protein